MSTLDPVELLARLIEARSYSGEEGPAADVVETALRAAGFAPQRLDHNVVCERGSGAAALLLNSHLDTVPASNGWTRDPWQAQVEGDRMYGLGATDAKSCVAAMAAAFVAADLPRGRRLIFTATVEEETGGVGGRPNGMQVVLAHLGALAAGVVGEPTSLNICTGQRGMVRILLHAEGRAGHASRPWEGANAIELAAQDVQSLRALADDIAVRGDDPLVGRPTIQATLIQGGTAANVIPDRCDVTLDIRTTRQWDNEAAVVEIQSRVKSRVELRSRRFEPVATDRDAAIVSAARAALPQAEVRPFGGVSDLFFLAKAEGGPVPAILLGPGDGRQSHQPDEFVSIAAVRQGAGAYRRLIEAFFRNTD